MSMDQQIAQLGQLGLNIYEAKAYAALLGKDSFTATQVATTSGVPRQRIYDILDALVERGLAIARPGKQGTRYTAVAPDQALNGLLAREQQRLTRLQAMTSQLVESLSRQYAAGQQNTRPLEYIEVLRGPTAISQRFAEIQENCKREILVFTKAPFAKPPQENVEGLETLKRNIRACSLYEYSVLEDEQTRAAVEFFIGQGEEARFVEHLPLKLVIVDEEIVLFAMEDPIAGRTDLTIMVVENKQLAQVMKVAFEALWERGVSIDEAIARVP